MRRRQSGVALITALILLAIATMLAVTIGHDSAMSARRSASGFSLEQSVQIAQGAEALAAYVLREDRNDTDGYDDAWSSPYGPVEVVPEVSLEAQLFDEQGKFNINTLVGRDGTVDEDALAVFARLMDLLGIEPDWAQYVVDWVDPDVLPHPQGGEDSLYISQMPPYRAANLAVTSVSELEQIPGFGRERYLLLLPHVTALPPSAATINVCTATPYVLDALYALSEQNRNNVEYSNMDPEQLAQSRAERCFPRAQVISAGEERLSARIGERSDYFQLRTWVRIGVAEFALYSLMYRDGNGQARPVMRSFGTE